MINLEEGSLRQQKENHFENGLEVLSLEEDVMNCEIEVVFHLLELTLLPLHPVPSCFWLLFNLLIDEITLWLCLKFFL